MEQRDLTVLHAESELLCSSVGDAQRFDDELKWLAECHHGELQPTAAGTTVLSFQTPLPALRMAVDLLRVAATMRLRIGLISGPCTVAISSATHATALVVGDEPARAASVARGAAAGSILISAETYRSLADVFASEVCGCVVTEEYWDAELAHAMITPAPTAFAEMSSFAGLGRI
jgi:class 3 adenylate cyclase